jgi:hypothetical protein
VGRVERRTVKIEQRDHSKEFASLVWILMTFAPHMRVEVEGFPQKSRMIDSWVGGGVVIHGSRLMQGSCP